MKKVLLLLVALAVIVSCSKEGMDIQGKWLSSTDSGELVMELLSGGNGIAYFRGCSSSDIYWSYSDGDLSIIGGAYNKDFERYKFEEATLVGEDVIHIKVTIIRYMGDKTKTLTFTRQ